MAEGTVKEHEGSSASVANVGRNHRQRHAPLTKKSVARIYQKRENSLTCKASMRSIYEGCILEMLHYKGKLLAHTCFISNDECNIEDKIKV